MNTIEPSGRSKDERPIYEQDESIWAKPSKKRGPAPAKKSRKEKRW